MKKLSYRKAMSTMGYLIAIVMILGVVMIVIAPFMLDNSNENSEKNEPAQTSNNNYEQNIIDISKIEQRFEHLEARINTLQNNSQQDNYANSNKYVCTIEGKLDDNGNVVSVDTATKNNKFVFVCEYR